jgi:hypothetical protein
MRLSIPGFLVPSLAYKLPVEEETIVASSKLGLTDLRDYSSKGPMEEFREVIGILRTR